MVLQRQWIVKYKQDEGRVGSWSHRNKAEIEKTSTLRPSKLNKMPFERGNIGRVDKSLGFRVICAWVQFPDLPLLLSKLLNYLSFIFLFLFFYSIPQDLRYKSWVNYKYTPLSSVYHSFSYICLIINNI
jgi:hypothetical protein